MFIPRRRHHWTCTGGWIYDVSYRSQLWSPPRSTPPPLLPLKVVSPCRNHSPRSVAPPSSFRFPVMSPPDDLSTRPSPPKPQPSADVQRILAQPTLLAPIKRPISRCRSVGDLASPPPTPSTFGSETLVEVPRRPRKLQRPRSRCSSTSSLALPSVSGSTPVEHHNQEWFVLNAVQPGEGWDEDKIRVGTPTEEVPQAAAELALRVRSRVQRFIECLILNSFEHLFTLPIAPYPKVPQTFQQSAYYQVPRARLLHFSLSSRFQSRMGTPKQTVRQEPSMRRPPTIN
ncbi:hypothetical protein BKA70DRAFT_680438 [Coprinopsis sp. MPI-PUGE-AT-0042]|nr:hypothetical protein BKA70DRAFT_680438 [Coprinopsis sp. MPI-PUGE-AT-0042]